MVLEILISGLVAFVRESCKVTDKSKIQIVMVKGEHDTDDKRHKPRLIADVLDVQPPDDGDLLPDEIIEIEESQWAVWSLENYQIEIMKAPKIQIVEGKRSKVNGKDEYARKTPKKKGAKQDPRDDFSWAPEMGRACDLPKKHVAPKAEVSTDGELGYGADDKRVVFAVARFRSLYLEPYTNSGASRLEPVIKKSEEQKVFAFGRYPYSQVLADSAKLAMTLPDADPPIITICLVKLDPNTPNPSDDGACEKKIRLKPRKGKDTVSISVSNLPNLRPEDPDPNKLEEVMHFRDYVRLFDLPVNAVCETPKEVKTTKASPAMDEQDKGVHPVKCVICADCGP
jgi:hypothetical protein